MVTVLDNSNQSYSFIGVDASLNPGPRRPLNFIGQLNRQEYSYLEEIERKSRQSVGTIWFGHFPTSCIISPHSGLRHLMSHSSAYLCGHLHSMAGLVPKMYTQHQNGLLELELGDWKSNRL